MINVIACVDINNAIAKDGRIPWDIPEDKAFFKNLTMGSVLIMGRKTYEDIGFPLPGRHTIVISSKYMNFKSKLLKNETLNSIVDMQKNLSIARSFENAIDMASNFAFNSNKKIFVCGGSQIYNKAIEICDQIFLTKVYKDYLGDCFFPKIPSDNFLEETISEIVKDNIKIAFQKYKRK